jgi:hypothetical protein
VQPNTAAALRQTPEKLQPTVENAVSVAFSSEVDTGSREENASKQKTGARL